MKGLEKCDESSGLRRIQILPIGGHISATLQDLPHELIRCQPDGNRIESRAALAANFANGVAVVALLGLKYERSLDFERSASAHEFRWDGSGG
jgi:hypothetical protein